MHLEFITEFTNITTRQKITHSDILRGILKSEYKKTLVLAKEKDRGEDLDH